MTPKLRALLKPISSASRRRIRRPRSFIRRAAARGKQRVRRRLRELPRAAARTPTSTTRPDPSQPLLHDSDEVDVDDRVRAIAARPSRYRSYASTWLWQHPPYFHDGSAADLEAVVDHYVGALELELTPRQRTDLVEFLKSL